MKVTHEKLPDGTVRLTVAPEDLPVLLFSQLEHEDVSEVWRAGSERASCIGFINTERVRIVEDEFLAAVNDDVLSEDELDALWEEALRLAAANKGIVSDVMRDLVMTYLAFFKGSRSWLVAATQEAQCYSEVP